MENKTYKLLVHNGIMVNESFLYSGIYESPTPILRSNEMTLKKIEDSWKDFWINSGIDLDTFVENLNKCELINVKIVKV